MLKTNKKSKKNSLEKIIKEQNQNIKNKIKTKNKIKKIKKSKNN